jgi:hypothetical protein
VVARRAARRRLRRSLSRDVGREPLRDDERRRLLGFTIRAGDRRGRSTPRASSPGGSPGAKPVVLVRRSREHHVGHRRHERVLRDRSLGSAPVTYGTSASGPNQLRAAEGINADYDAAGNLVQLRLDRGAATCPGGAGSRCAQWFVYDWDESRTRAFGRSLMSRVRALLSWVAFLTLLLATTPATTARLVSGAPSTCVHDAHNRSRTKCASPMRTSYVGARTRVGPWL